MGEKILECNNLQKRFGAQRAVDGMTFSMDCGRVVGLLGPNGSGKTTFMKLANGLLRPDGGTLTIAGHAPGTETKAVVSFLPDRMYFADWMKVEDLLHTFSDFYTDFRADMAREMLESFGVSPQARMKTLSKGTQEKVQLVLVMSRRAKLYLLDEPIGGVDPAAREFILRTILNYYSEDSTVVLATHLIADVEKILDEVVFLQNGRALLHETVDALREKEGKSVDALFRELYAVTPPVYTRA